MRIRALRRQSSRLCFYRYGNTTVTSFFDPVYFFYRIEWTSSRPIVVYKTYTLIYKQNV